MINSLKSKAANALRKGVGKITSTLDKSSGAAGSFTKEAFNPTGGDLLYKTGAAAIASKLSVIGGAGAVLAGAKLAKGIANKTKGAGMGTVLGAGLAGATAISRAAEGLYRDQAAAHKSQMNYLDLDRKLKLKQQAAKKIRTQAAEAQAAPMIKDAKEYMEKRGLTGDYKKYMEAAHNEVIRWK